MKTKFSKLALLAVQYRLCLYWKIHPDDNTLEMRVVTGDTINGKQISRHILTVRTLKQAYEVSQTLMKMGGCVFTGIITRWGDSFNPWAFGWNPDLAALKDETKQMGDETYHFRHPDWDGWHSYKRQAGAKRVIDHDTLRGEMVYPTNW